MPHSPTKDGVHPRRGQIMTLDCAIDPQRRCIAMSKEAKKKELNMTNNENLGKRDTFKSKDNGN